MKTLSIGNWHFWKNHSGMFYASDESCKQLFEYNSFDAMVNGIYVYDPVLARQLNKEWHKCK